MYPLGTQPATGSGSRVLEAQGATFTNYPRVACARQLGSLVMDRLETPLPVPLAIDAVGAIIDGIRHGHHLARNAFVEEEGWDTTAYGVVAYRLSWHWVEEEAREAGVKTGRPDGSLRVYSGLYAIGVYSAGIAGGDWNPHSYDFERTPGRVRQAACNDSGQGEFFTDPELHALVPPPEGPRLASLTELAAVVVANPDEGCVGIYLGAPEHDASSDTYRWSWVRRIHQADTTAQPVGGEEAAVGPVAGPRSFDTVLDPAIDIIERDDLDDLDEDGRTDKQPGS